MKYIHTYTQVGCGLRYRGLGHRISRNTHTDIHARIRTYIHTYIYTHRWAADLETGAWDTEYHEKYMGLREFLSKPVYVSERQDLDMQRENLNLCVSLSKHMCVYEYTCVCACAGMYILNRY
jgi:hypothetical protein